AGWASAVSLFLYREVVRLTSIGRLRDEGAVRSGLVAARKEEEPGCHAITVDRLPPPVPPPSTSEDRRRGRAPAVRPCASSAAPLGAGASLEEVDRGPTDVEADPGLIGCALHALFR